MLNDLLRTAGLIAIVPGIIVVVTHLPWCMHCAH